jgi:hypothetical protein
MTRNDIRRGQVLYEHAKNSLGKQFYLRIGSKRVKEIDMCPTSKYLRKLLN